MGTQLSPTWSSQVWTLRTTPSSKPIRLLNKNTGPSSSIPSTKVTPSSQPETSRQLSTLELPSLSDQKPSSTNSSLVSPLTPPAKASTPFQTLVSPWTDNTIHSPPRTTSSKSPNSDKLNASSVSNPWTSQP